MKKLLGIFVILISLTSCGPSAAEKKKMEEKRRDSLAAIRDESTSSNVIAEPNVNVSHSHGSKCYLASDFGLVPGVIVRWAPSDETLNAVPEGQTYPDIWVHVLQPNGIVKIIKTDEVVWKNLYTGDTLK